MLVYSSKFWAKCDKISVWHADNMVKHSEVHKIFETCCFLINKSDAIFVLFDKELREMKIDWFISDAYLGSCQTSKMDVFVRTINGFQSNCFWKSSILNVLLGS